MSPALYPNGIPALEKWYRDRKKLREVPKHRWELIEPFSESPIYKKSPKYRSMVYSTPSFLGMPLKTATRPPLDIVNEAACPIEGVNGLLFKGPTDLVTWHTRTVRAFYQHQFAKVRKEDIDNDYWRHDYPYGPRKLEVVGPYNNVYGNPYVQYRIPKGTPEVLNFNKPLLTQAFVVQWENHVKNLRGQWSEDVDDEREGAMEQLAGEWAKEFILSSSQMFEKHPWRGNLHRSPKLFYEAFQEKLDAIDREVQRAWHVIWVLDWEIKNKVNNLAVGEFSPLYCCPNIKCFCGNKPRRLQKISQLDSFSLDLPISQRASLYWVDFFSDKRSMIQDPTWVDYHPKDYYKSRNSPKDSYMLRSEINAYLQ